MLTNHEAQSDLPTDGEFLNLFEWTDEDCGNIIDSTPIHEIISTVDRCFYIRKEILRVLQNFKNIYQNQLSTGEVVESSLILIGYTGAGKSYLLALICIYIQSSIDKITQLFIGNKYYTWNDDGFTIYNSLIDTCENANSITGPSLMVWL
ncbi:hypothetical protein THRCLA_20893 [Thraustotheca clavata]|uniref:Crinkler (CRN) family protein n=1 Tax=Thraustotheca clavata TaxID=74557 RepID=A0A1W0A2F9_9STRA|nr:hypothetical protein THRCLA_20893 [Thraustotheca clavata]